MPARLHYFAYGSNMLAERLQRRCPSAQLCGAARLDHHALDFSKVANDISGKATIFPASGHHVEGVLFTLDCSEQVLLDGFEGLGKGYDRLNDVPVRLLSTGETITAMTYIAMEEFRDATRRPFDWYLWLVRAGARQNRLTDRHIERLAAEPFIVDPEEARRARLEALDILRKAGFDPGTPEAF
ncbi:gamma-glutamylcyclotransferase family protein [Martelella mediterranea]|uniref:Gamma-glutamyl AIG2-like cyclotransferase n=1 Tax=Martelella mediterranea TaxID=293089 RepID=A0A4V2V3S8_9HYPH|nr:gamma-glutamylcyclotransferase family protein [Martelella mediterranea]TCT35285.1 gamma-glutamyl AIG2-like cyclotransferase [Martelella mediterranea]